MNARKQTLNLALVALLLTGTAVSTVACSSTRSTESQISDAEITASVKTRLAADPDVAAIDIDVDTLEGVVTLNGVVKTASERDEAVKLARGTEHVRRVVNNLKIEG
jgi:hyperosmotically inducible protein